MWTRIGNIFSLFLCILLLCCPLLSCAEEASFEATVNSNTIALEDVLTLTLSVRGVKDKVPVVPLPGINGFDVRFVGPSSSFTIINGVSSNEHSFIYNLFPSKAGHFQIPSISLVLDGKTYATKPIDIEVTNKPSASSSTQEKDNKQESIEDKVYMKAFVEPSRVYVGQKTPLKMKVYVKDLSLQLASAPSLVPEGFTTDSTCDMQKGKENINGLMFDVLTFETNIYPTREGVIAVGPFKAEGQLIYRLRENNDFFSDFFSRDVTKPITLHAPDVSVEVDELPLNGKPADFSGAVGQYDFKASVGPLSVKVGDPLTLRMTVSGEGRLKDLQMPILKDSRFKTYDPQEKEEENSKIVEQVIIPTDSTIHEVPALTFSFFDPATKEYKTITQGPFPITVTPPAKEEEFKAYGFTDTSKAAADKPSVRLISMDQAGLWLFHKAQQIFKDWRIWLIIIVVCLAWIGLKLWQGFQLRLKNDHAFARRLKALPQAQEGIKQAQEFLKQGKVKEFYDMVFKTLQNYLADRMHKPAGSLSWELVQAELKTIKIDEPFQSDLKAMFDKCDYVRFAAASMDQSTMQDDLQKLQAMVAYLDKNFK